MELAWQEEARFRGRQASRFPLACRVSPPPLCIPCTCTRTPPLTDDFMNHIGLWRVVGVAGVPHVLGAVKHAKGQPVEEVAGVQLPGGGRGTKGDEAQHGMAL